MTAMSKSLAASLAKALSGKGGGVEEEEIDSPEDGEVEDDAAPEEEEGSPALDAADALVDAIKDRDAEAIVTALRAVFDSFQADDESQPDDEEE